MRSATLIGPTTRLRLLCALLLTGFLVLAARAAHLTLVDSRGRGWGERQIRTVLELPAPRGMIVDRRGVELAITVHAPSIYVMPHDLEDLESTAKQLARALDLDARGLAEQLRDRDRFTFVARWATREQARRVHALELPGVGVLEEPRRAYPAGALAGQVIGFANIDGVGVRAIEQQEDATLRGEERTVRVERDARGRLLVEDPALPRDMAGGDVELTIDAALQAEAEGALQGALERTGAHGGVVVSIDPHTGDILALAEAPAVDPNVFRELDFASTRSRAFLDALEPGSTLKAFLVAAALESGVIAPGDRLDTTPGWMRVPGKTIRDHHDYGVLRIADVLQVSSNVGAVMIAQRLEPRRHYEMLRSFGFGAPTGSGFPQESAGLLRPYEGWQPVDRATVAFGQGISVTPVQLAAATAALANGGVWQQPRLVGARRQARGAWKRIPVEPGRRVVSESTARETLGMLETVVSATGTGRRAALHGLRVAGKTGTAQKFDPEAGHYSRTAYLAWFLGIVPADDPQLAVVAVLDEPQGRAAGGGDTAAPLFAQVAAAQLAHLGIATAPEAIPSKPFPTLVAKAEARKKERAERRAQEEARRRQELASRERAERAEAAPPVRAAEARRRTRKPERPHEATEPRPQQHAGAGAAATASVATPARFVPDFLGETLRSAQQMAERDSLVLELEGDRRGLAVEQHPDPGTVVTGEHPRVRLRFTLGMEEG